MPNPQTHIFEVEMKISDFSTKENLSTFNFQFGEVEDI